MSLHDQRKYTRFGAAVDARVRLVSAEEAEALRRSFASAPSVWKLHDEATIRSLANQSGSDITAVLAQAVLELSAQVARLQARIDDAGQPMQPARLVQLSGGGGLISTPLPVRLSDVLEVRFQDDDRTPPIHALIQIVHARGKPEGFGFRFEAIHRHDQDRLIRLIYQIQRDALPKAHA